MSEGVQERPPSREGTPVPRQGEVLRGNSMIYAEGEGTAVLYKELLKKKKAIKTKFTLSSKEAKAALAENRAKLGSHYYSDMVRARIHVAVEEAIGWQTQFNQTFSEMLTMIDSLEYDEEGAQEREKQRFYDEIKSEWDKEVKRLAEYRDYLTSTEAQIAHPGARGSGDRSDREETVTR